MNETEKALHQRIHEVFPTEPLPTADEMTRCTRMKRYGGQLDHPCWECSDVIEFYAGRRWDEITIAESRANSEGISYMSKQAFLYYLPAWMCGTLEDWETADIVPDNILYGIVRNEQMGWKWDELMEEMTLDQLECLRDFIECDKARITFEHFMEEPDQALAIIQPYIDSKRRAT